MLAAHCSCTPPQVFDDSETCNTCGHQARIRIHASTWRLALAIAHTALNPLGRHSTTLNLDDTEGDGTYTARPRTWTT